MWLLRWLTGWYYKRLRAVDVDILWPVCCQKADNLAHARAAFAVHAFTDDAWRWLGEAEILKQIDALEPPPGLPTGGVEL